MYLRVYVMKNLTLMNGVIDFNIKRESNTHEKKLNIFNRLKKCNHYLININGARNYALDYGKKEGYEWIFVLDSNSFLNKNDYEEIINNIALDTEYIAIPSDPNRKKFRYI